MSAGIWRTAAGLFPAIIKPRVSDQFRIAFGNVYQPVNSKRGLRSLAVRMIRKRAVLHRAHVRSRRSVCNTALW